MATQKTQAGSITRGTNQHITRIPVAAATTITKGDVCSLVGGFLAPAAAAAIGPFYVALEDIDNSIGAAGDVDCPCAVNGQYVTVVVSVAAGIAPGGAVIIGATDGQVIDGTGSAANITVGTYSAEEGGIITQDTLSPFAETLEDNEEFDRVEPSGDGAVIEIHLGAF